MSAWPDPATMSDDELVDQRAGFARLVREARADLARHVDRAKAEIAELQAAGFACDAEIVRRSTASKEIKS